MSEWIYNYKLSSSLLTASILYIGILVASYLITTDRIERVINYIVLILGATVGWICGTLFAPYPGEAKEFAQFTTYISTFFSGYFLAKVDPLVTRILSPDYILTINRIAAFRICTFTSSVAIFLIITFIFRRYAGIDILPDPVIPTR